MSLAILEPVQPPNFIGSRIIRRAPIPIDIGPLAEELVDFFKRRPDEELLSSDIAAKFDTPPENISRQLKRAVHQRFISREIVLTPSEDGTSKRKQYIYRAGSGA